MVRKSDIRAAGGLIAALVTLFAFAAIAAIQALRWFVGALVDAFGSDLVARSKARRQLAAFGVVVVGACSSSAIAAIQSGTEWHSRYSEYSDASGPAALVIAVATAIFAWTQLTSGGRPRRWARSLAFALAYGSAVCVALIARHDRPTLAYARDAIARRDFEAASITAQTIVDHYSSQSAAAAALLDDVRDARIAAAPTLAASADFLNHSWASEERRQAASRAWLTRFDRAVEAAFTARNAPEIANLAAAAALVNQTRATQTSELSVLVRRSLTLPSTQGQQCDTTLPTQGSYAALATEYRTRVREAAQTALTAARRAHSTAMDWDDLLRLSTCSSQLGDAPPMELAAIQQQLARRRH